MKRTKTLVLGTVLFLGVCFGTTATAEEMKGSMDMKQGSMAKDEGTMNKGGMGMMGMMKGDMMDKDGMMKMCPMMAGMLQKSMVASNDGGVIVLSGNKLIKYDKDLAVVKEVEIKMDMEAMPDMMKMCPMMGKGMAGEMKEDSSKGDATGGSAPADEHASHHPENK